MIKPAESAVAFEAQLDTWKAGLDDKTKWLAASKNGNIRIQTKNGKFVRILKCILNALLFGVIYRPIRANFVAKQLFRNCKANKAFMKEGTIKDKALEILDILNTKTKQKYQKAIGGYQTFVRTDKYVSADKPAGKPEDPPPPPPPPPPGWSKRPNQGNPASSGTPKADSSAAASASEPVEALPPPSPHDLFEFAALDELQPEILKTIEEGRAAHQAALKSEAGLSQEQQIAFATRFSARGIRMRINEAIGDINGLIEEKKAAELALVQAQANYDGTTRGQKDAAASLEASLGPAARYILALHHAKETYAQVVSRFTNALGGTLQRGHQDPFIESWTEFFDERDLTDPETLQSVKDLITRANEQLKAPDCTEREAVEKYTEHLHLYIVNYLGKLRNALPPAAPSRRLPQVPPRTRGRGRGLGRGRGAAAVASSSQRPDNLSDSKFLQYRSALRNVKSAESRFPGKESAVKQAKDARDRAVAACHEENSAENIAALQKTAKRLSVAEEAQTRARNALETLRSNIPKIRAELIAQNIATDELLKTLEQQVSET